MKYFVFLMLLQCILGTEIRNGICSDGKECPQGKYCCKSGCCDLPKELEGKSFAPGFLVSSATNLSVAEPEAMHAPCYGTQCGNYCIPNIRRGVCCRQPKQACPANTVCCSNVYLTYSWCCKRRQLCSTIDGLCINGAITNSINIISMLFAFMIGIAAKYLA